MSEQEMKAQNASAVTEVKPATQVNAEDTGSTQAGAANAAEVSQEHQPETAAEENAASTASPVLVGLVQQAAGQFDAFNATIKKIFMTATSVDELRAAIGEAAESREFGDFIFGHAAYNADPGAIVNLYIEQLRAETIPTDQTAETAEEAAPPTEEVSTAATEAAETTAIAENTAGEGEPPGPLVVPQSTAIQEVVQPAA